MGCTTPPCKSKGGYKTYGKYCVWKWPACLKGIYQVTKQKYSDRLRGCKFHQLTSPDEEGSEEWRALFSRTFISKNGWFYYHENPGWYKNRMIYFHDFSGHSDSVFFGSIFWLYSPRILNPTRDPGYFREGNKNRTRGQGGLIAPDARNRLHAVLQRREAWGIVEDVNFWCMDGGWTKDI